MQLRLTQAQKLRRYCEMDVTLTERLRNPQVHIVRYRRNHRRIFRRAAPHGVSAPLIGVHYMPFTHSVERWHA